MLCGLDHLLIGVQDTALAQDTATPIRTAADNLRMHRSLLAQILRAQGGQGVMNVSADGMLGSLHRNEVLIIAFASLHLDPAVAIVALGFVALDEIPSLCDQATRSVSWAYIQTIIRRGDDHSQEQSARQYHIRSLQSRP